MNSQQRYEDCCVKLAEAVQKRRLARERMKKFCSALLWIAGLVACLLYWENC